MPDLRGYGENQAKVVLDGLGIQSAQIEVQYQSRVHLGPLFDQVPAYAVVSSMPEPGTPLSSASIVILGIRAPDESVTPQPAVTTDPSVIHPDVFDVQPNP